MSDNTVAARALAREFGIEDEVVEQPRPLIDRVSFTTLRTLSPGQDFYNNVLYYTVPTFLHTTRTVGKGKDQRTEPYIEKYASCLTSEHELFMYTAEELYDRGFAYPSVFMTPNQTQWGGETARRIARGEMEPPDPQELYFQVRRLYEEYMEYADETYFDIMTCWVLGSYMYKVFRTYPYLHFNGTRDSGKSQNLRILKVVGFNTQWTSEMTAPDLYRGIAGNPGVVCIDEEEKWQGERAEALKAILRSGYGEGVEVSRQRQKADNTWERDYFAVYCPKALASINPLDDTTRSRCIVVQMRPALRNIVEFDSTKVERWAELRDKLHLWGLSNAAQVHTLYNDWAERLRFTKAEGLTNRSWEISSAIITISNYIGGDAMSDPIITWLTNYFENQRKQTDSTDLTRLLALSLPTLIRDNTAREGWYYPMKQVLDNLTAFMDADTIERVTTRTIRKLMTPLGFTDFKQERGGGMIRITEATLRRVIKERRIEARAEDADWLEGSVDYQTEARAAPVAQTFSWESAHNDSGS